MHVKRFIAIFLCAMLAMPLIACSQESGAENKGSSDTTKEERESSSACDGDKEETGSGDGEDSPSIKQEGDLDGFTPEASISESGGVAVVETADGLIYSARGYDSVSDGTFVISKGFEITLDSALFEKSFNRTTICYIATEPMKCTLTYSVGGEKMTDSYFLEAGEKMFSGLIADYLGGKYATQLEKISFELLRGESAELMIYNAVTMKREVYDQSTYYLENNRFKIGLRLIWGGGICYVEDKACQVPKLTNLINIHDAGRLIQQSYYGTPGNDEYQPGNYNGTNWVYNPVQGGDQYWNKSRLIDIVVSESSVYVKAQPQDWSLNGQITPSYMENTYTVFEDRIEVDNRFTDFSGWEHRFAHQELPAFYTVSYLDSFTYYNGLSPWTDDELIRHDGLPFSGGEEKEQCYFKFLSSNTETWCAWTNVEDDYGIGLYTPGADLVLAGRFEDGHSKRPQDNSCSYVAPVNTLKICSFESIEYSYMITTGSVEEIRAVFKEHKDFAANDYLSSENSSDIRIPDVAVSFENINFSTAEHNKYISALNSATVKFNSTYNAVALIVLGADPQISIPYSHSSKRLSAKDYDRIVIEYMVPATNSPDATVGELFLCTGDTMNAEQGKSVAIEYAADGRWHTLEISLSDLDFWSGRINSIRFDFANGGNAGDTVYVRSIRLEKK